MINLEGKVALITGASGAIGSAAARLLHKQGAELVISGTNEAKLNALKDELSGSNVRIRTCDLHNMEDCQKMVEEMEKIDILVCNAGITRDMLSIKMSNESFAEVLDINLKASFILNRSAIQKMIRAKAGRIINISSIVAVSGNPGQANYCASKAGLIGMTKSLAIEVASRGVTVNAVAPGFIQSDMTDKLNDMQKDAILGRIPKKAMGQPGDIANAIAFLASDEASYITGQTLHVNGGMLMV
jgi:3-oxoacyl-[acyl-carrier protein] reductase